MGNTYSASHFRIMLTFKPSSALLNRLKSQWGQNNLTTATTTKLFPNYSTFLTDFSYIYLRPENSISQLNKIPGLLFPGLMQYTVGIQSSNKTLLLWCLLSQDFYDCVFLYYEAHNKSITFWSLDFCAVLFSLIIKAKLETVSCVFDLLIWGIGTLV